MGRDEVLLQLQERLSKFTVTDQCRREIETFVLKCGNRKAFLKLLVMRRKQLNALSPDQLVQLNEFELLKQASNLYSMHLKGKGFNYRILYQYLSDGEVLLLGFEEKHGKKVTEYSNFIPTALERLEIFLKGDGFNG